MRLIHWLYCFGLALGHFLYTLSFPSLINGERFLGTSSKLLEPSYLHAFFLSRIKFGEFARRPLTTWFIKAVEGIGISLEWSFLVVEYAGIIVSIILLFRLTLLLTNKVKYAYASTGIFITSFWVLHALFAEIYAYDEPWQYAAIFASFFFLKSKRWLPFSLFFFIALVARESTILLLPGIYFFFILQKPLLSKSNLINTFKVGWVVPAYGVFLFVLIRALNLGTKSSSYMEDVRFKHLYYSFATTDLGIDTLTSFCLSIAVAVTLLYYRRFIPSDKTDKPWVWAFALNFGINAFITFTLTMGRETRIFAQPVLLLSPFLGFYFIEGIKNIGKPFGSAFHNYESFAKWLSAFLFFSSVVFACSLFSYELYWPTDTKFFSGFQHWAFITISLCFLLVILDHFRSKSKYVAKESIIPSLLFLLPVILFFGNQNGFRAYDTFSPVKSHAAHVEELSGRSQYLVVSSTMPNLAENYFQASDVNCLAGDFNFQLPMKQFLYRKEQYINSDILYLELEPAINFPFKYILSHLGKIDRNIIGERVVYQVKTDEPCQLEPNTFLLDEKRKGFLLKQSGNTSGDEILELNEEYSVAFKSTIKELGIDSLYSFAAKSDFECDMDSEAALVVTIKSPDRNEVWEHEFLSIYLIDEKGWNTAYMAKGNLDFTNPMTEIAFYVWNPKNDDVKIRNLEIVLNTQWVSMSKKPKSVLDSRNLE